GRAGIKLAWPFHSQQKLNRPPILPLWKDRWPVTGNLSSSAKSSTRDSPSPHRPSQRRADRNNNSDGCSVYSSDLFEYRRLRKYTTKVRALSLCVKPTLVLGTGAV